MLATNFSLACAPSPWQIPRVTGIFNGGDVPFSANMGQDWVSCPRGLHRGRGECGRWSAFLVAPELFTILHLRPWYSSQSSANFLSLLTYLSVSSALVWNKDLLSVLCFTRALRPCEREVCLSGLGTSSRKLAFLTASMSLGTSSASTRRWAAAASVLLRMAVRSGLFHFLFSLVSGDLSEDRGVGSGVVGVERLLNALYLLNVLVHGRELSFVDWPLPPRGELKEYPRTVDARCYRRDQARGTR